MSVVNLFANQIWVQSPAVAICFCFFFISVAKGSIQAHKIDYDFLEIFWEGTLEMKGARISLPLLQTWREQTVKNPMGGNEDYYDENTEANSQLLVTNYHEGVGGQNTWGSSLR